VFDGRKRIASVLATLCVTALSGAVLTSATPSYAKPSIHDVQSQVDTLYRQAEQASERYNNASGHLKEAQSRLKSLQADLARQDAKVTGIRKQVAAAVVSQYQGQALSSTTQVLLSKDPDAFLNQISTVSEYNDQQGQMMANFATQAKQLEMRQTAAKRELAQISRTKQQLATEKAQIDKKAGEAKALLGRLKDRAAARRDAQSTSRDASRAPAVSNVPVSGRAAAAVQYAMAQVGKAYVYGAAGPDAFDCSGLTMMAWAQAGVALPHSSSGQMGSGTPVSESDLQPGDLVFYYSPVSHVGMYIGNGMIVNAENPSAGVKVTPVNSMPYSGAVRPG
jgi:cell wall-associated NlpC family hydrolase